MQARLKLKPGQRGTKKLVAQYGDRLVCVRYRYDPPRKKRYKTVELIVEEVDWQPRPKRPSPDTRVGVRVEWGEAELGRQVKHAGGTWDRQRRVWDLRYDKVVELGLEGRIVQEAGL